MDHDHPGGTGTEGCRPGCSRRCTAKGCIPDSAAAPGLALRPREGVVAQSLWVQVKDDRR